VLEIRFEGAGKKGHDAAFHLGGTLTDVLEELAIVRHHDERAAPFAQELLKQQQRGEVEVVCGFVEQEQRWLVEKQCRQLGAHLPAARERSKRARQLFALDAEFAGGLGAGPVGLSALAQEKIGNRFAGNRLR
jgi:hypothetical protein